MGVPKAFKGWWRVRRSNVFQSQELLRAFQAQFFSYSEHFSKKSGTGFSVLGSGPRVLGIRVVEAY